MALNEQSDKLSPLMEQYLSIKSELPEKEKTLLFFRLGDFYEMFFEDAIIGARLLNLTLTNRNKIPMCGVPYHAVNSYIKKILMGGEYKIALCDQTPGCNQHKGQSQRGCIECGDAAHKRSMNEVKLFNINDVLKPVNETPRTMRCWRDGHWHADELANLASNLERENSELEKTINTLRSRGFHHHTAPENDVI